MAKNINELSSAELDLINKMAISSSFEESDLTRSIPLFMCRKLAAEGFKKSKDEFSAKQYRDLVDMINNQIKELLGI